MIEKFYLRLHFYITFTTFQSEILQSCVIHLDTLKELLKTKEAQNSKMGNISKELRESSKTILKLEDALQEKHDSLKLLNDKELAIENGRSVFKAKQLKINVQVNFCKKLVELLFVYYK